MGKEITKEDKETVYRFLIQVKNIGHFKFRDQYVLVFPERVDHPAIYDEDYKLIAEVTKVIEGTLHDNALYLRPTDKGKSITFWGYNVGSVIYGIKEFFGNFGTGLAFVLSVIALMNPQCNFQSPNEKKCDREQQKDTQYKSTPSIDSQASTESLHKTTPEILQSDSSATDTVK